MTGAPPRRRHELPLPSRPGAPRALVLGERTLVLGIVNVTPDSFSDGGWHDFGDAAHARALQMLDEGADLLDVGGESTRPGAAEVPAEEQLRRVIPEIEALRRRAPHVPIAVDTRNAAVARAAVAAGASIVNDVSGLAHDPAMRAAVAELDVPAIVMHMRGTPADMRERASYGDVVREVLAELRGSLDAARAAGCRHLIADPGLGFAKTAEQSAALLAATDDLAALGVPILIGASRKSFLAPSAPPGAAPAERTGASLAAAALAAWLGAHVVRVHDVAQTVQAVRVADFLRRASDPAGSAAGHEG